MNLHSGIGRMWELSDIWYSQGGLVACLLGKSLKLRCSEIASEDIFGPNWPLEQLFQYSYRRLAARQKHPSQAKPKHCISWQLQIFESTLWVYIKVHRTIADLNNALLSQWSNLCCKLKRQQHIQLYYRPNSFVQCLGNGPHFACCGVNCPKCPFPILHLCY